MTNMKALLAGFMGMSAAFEAAPPADARATAVATPRFQGVIMPPKQWQKRKKRLSMQKASRKANRS